jgi:hypothetical protein
MEAARALTVEDGVGVSYRLHQAGGARFDLADEFAGHEFAGLDKALWLGARTEDRSVATVP